MFLGSFDDDLVKWVATHRWAPLNDPFVWLGDVNRLGAVRIGLAVAVGILHHAGVLRLLALALLTAVTTVLADSASFAIKIRLNAPGPRSPHSLQTYVRLEAA